MLFPARKISLLDNLYGTSLVAADAKTGRYLWHFQVVHHDVFDFDLESAPVLLDVKQGSRTIPAVAVFGKSSLPMVIRIRQADP